MLAFLQRILWLCPVVILIAGCETMESRSPVSTVSQAQASQAGRVVQLGAPGRISAWGAGESMAPLYDENTYVVVEPIAFEDLREGMIVAYRNRNGQNVVHRLVRLENGAWVAEGINNPAIDRDKVTPQNLLGVVYATFYAVPK